MRYGPFLKVDVSSKNVVADWNSTSGPVVLIQPKSLGIKVLYNSLLAQYFNFHLSLLMITL